MLPVTYFDGQTSRRYAVMLELTAGVWRVQADGVDRSVPMAAARLSEKIGNAPRQLHFEDGAYCIILDHLALDSMLHAAGVKPRSIVSGLEGKWRYALASVMLIVLFFGAVYQWGLPWAARAIAERLPASLPAMMDTQTMATLDQYLLEPSSVSLERQQGIISALAVLEPVGNEELPEYQVLFRSGEKIGPNAFAMPGGTILVTDELIQLADASHPNQPQLAMMQVLGVLAHEIGHVRHRHAMRQFLQGTIVGAVVTWYLGDVSSLLVAAPTALLETRYSRAFEFEADAFAVALMKANDLSPTAFADMLNAMEQHYRGQDAGHDETAVPSDPQWLDYFSTHPNTQARIRRLRDLSQDEVRQ